MTTPEDKERELNLRKAELEAKKRELKLREMEAEIYQEQKSDEVDVDPPMYRTEKHNPPDSSIQKFGRKIVNFAKFSAFVMGGIIVIRVGFLVGMWITYLMMTGIIAAIGYQIFLKDDK